MGDADGKAGPGGPHARGAAWLALAIGLVALAARLMTVGDVFRDGGVHVPILDESYHARRIVEAVRRPAFLSEPDPRRGVSGAFCPWPPGWDLSASLLARALGASGRDEVLRKVVLVPPVVGALLAGFGGFLASRRWGPFPGFVTGLLLALTAALLASSSAGQIDHHFLEPPLLLGVVAATTRVVRTGTVRDALVSGALLALALSGALFVQGSLLPAAALAAAAILATAEGPRALAAAAAGFGLAGVGVAAYRLGRPPSYPESEWFLGTPHAAALLAAAAAFAVAAARERSGRPRLASRLLGVGLGGLVLASVPEVPRTFLDGMRFFGGDPWLDQIAEFEPLVGASPTALLRAVLYLGGGAIVALLLPFRRSRGAGSGRTVLALFTLAYLVAACGRNRFSVQAAPLLAVAAGAVLATLSRGAPSLARAAVAALAVVPTLAGALPLLQPPVPAVLREGPALRAAAFLRASPSEGRVLAPWYLGHVLDFAGERGVLVDNFGSMPGRAEFQGSLEALLATREERLVTFCRRRGVRFVVLDNPTLLLSSTAFAAGRPPEAYLATGPGGGPPFQVTRLQQATVWWRAYFGTARTPGATGGFRDLRLAYVDPQPGDGAPPYAGPSLEIWEVLERAPTPR